MKLTVRLIALAIIAITTSQAQAGASIAPGAFTASKAQAGASIAPGAFTAAIGGASSIRVNANAFTLGDKGMSLGGYVDSAGNLTVSNANLPPFSPGGAFGSYRLQLVPTAPMRGTIDPRSGGATLTAPLYLTVEGPGIPPGCSVGSAAAPITLNTADTNPGGSLYNPANGATTVTDATVAIPAAQGCGDTTAVINQALGLPSPSGQNLVTIQLSFTPKFAGASCRVPSLLGKTAVQARKLLKKAGCKLGKVSKRKSSARKGRIVSQSPAARKTKSAGTAVKVVVSSGR